MSYGRRLSTSHEDCAVHISSAQFSARRSDVKDNVPLLHHSLIDDSFDAVRRNLAANGLGEGQIPEIGIHVRHIVGSQTTDASGVPPDPVWGWLLNDRQTFRDGNLAGSIESFL